MRTGRRDARPVRTTVKRFTRKAHPRASGQAARRLPRLKNGSEGVSCKRREAVRLDRREAVRPAGAASGALSGASVSWAAQRQFMPITLRYPRANCRRSEERRVGKEGRQKLGAGDENGTFHMLAEFFREYHDAWTRWTCKLRTEAATH